MKFDASKGHGIPKNTYNAHAWMLGKPIIGEDVWIGAFTMIDGLHDTISIGKGCNISNGVQIVTHSTVHRCISERKYPDVDHAPVQIGEYCFFGLNAVVLMGAKIGHHSIIGAGTVITENMEIPPYSLVVGVPGKIVGTTEKFK
jgi:acetyltransferase-like isoleucine patch superfamily enzyme